MRVGVWIENVIKMDWMKFLGYVHQLYGPYYRWAIIEMDGQDFSEGEVRNRRVKGSAYGILAYECRSRTGLRSSSAW